MRAPEPRPARRAGPTFLFAAIFAATLIAYAPAIGAGFIWNDSDYVTAPALRGWDGLWRIWFEVGATEQYYPMLHGAFWVEHKLWGDAATGYHLVNILLHATSACLLAAILRRLAIPGAWLAAFLFALHPVYVESVAWISEQKNTQSLVFYLLAAWLYLKFEDGRAARPQGSQINLLLQGRPAGLYVGATICFVIGLLSKSTTATLPPGLLVVLWWKRGRLDWKRDVAPLLPWFALGAAMGLFSAWVEKKYIGAEGAEFALTLVQRTLLAGRVAWFYLGKLLWPGELIFIYPRWTIDPGQWWQWVFPIGVVAAIVGLWLMRKQTRAPLAAALFFGGSLFPVIGFFNVFAFIFSYVADHWQYLPSIGVVVFVAALLARMSGLEGRARSPGEPSANARPERPARRSGPTVEPRVGKSGPIVAVLLVGALGVLTFHQSRMYADMRTFYRTTLARNPDAWMAHNNLGNLLREDKDPAAAVVHFEAALRVRPDLVKVHNNLANALHDLRRVPEAMEHYRQALKLDPLYIEAHHNLGNLLRETKQLDEAIFHLKEAVRLDPKYIDAHNSLGVALREAGRGDEAIASFERAVKLAPNFAPAHLNLALSYSIAGRETEAMEQFREARRLNPAIPDVFGR